MLVIWYLVNILLNFSVSYLIWNIIYNSKAFLHMNRLGIFTSKHKALRLIFELRVHSDEDLMSSKRVIEVYQFIILLLMIMIFFYKKSVLSKVFDSYNLTVIYGTKWKRAHWDSGICGECNRYRHKWTKFWRICSVVCNRSTNLVMHVFVFQRPIHLDIA